MDNTLRLLLDPVARMARYHDKCIRLTQREYALLQCLSTYHGQPVAAHKLMLYAWGQPQSGNRPRLKLDVYIFHLRRRLDRLGLKGAISTVRGMGYALAQALPRDPRSS